MDSGMGRGKPSHLKYFFQNPVKWFIPLFLALKTSFLSVYFESLALELIFFVLEQRIN